MRIEVKGRNLQVTDELRECVERRMDKIGKQVSELAVLEVDLADTRTPIDPVTAEAALQLKGTTLRAKSAAEDAKHAINLVSEDLARQVKRHRDKRRGRRESRAAAEQSRAGAQEAPVFEEEPSSSL
jgi:putative sigma-54 modulation protein